MPLRNLTVDHVGYLVENLEAAVLELKAIGFVPEGNPVCDYRQRARLCMMHNADNFRIELVAPFPDNLSLRKMLTHQPGGPYHVCYSTDTFESSLEALLAGGWVVLFSPVAAPAMGGRRICYLWKRELGFVELLEK